MAWCVLPWYFRWHAVWFPIRLQATWISINNNDKIIIVITIIMMIMIIIVIIIATIATTMLIIILIALEGAVRCFSIIYSLRRELSPTRTLK